MFSVLHAIIHIFEELVLKRDQSSLRLPPSCASVVVRFKGWDLDVDTPFGKLPAKDPTHATGGKDFSRDNEHRSAVPLDPVPQG